MFYLLSIRFWILVDVDHDKLYNVHYMAFGILLFTLVWCKVECLILRSNHVCAADKSNTGKDTCQNDSGGPMFLSENGRFVQCT